MIKAVSLDDKYALEQGRAYMSGVQALVPAPLMQRARDRAAGLRTAGFVSGYRGSPLGTYDEALSKAAGFLKAADVRFHPGLNEDLAATSVWGTQQVALLPARTVQGVFGIWYGKGPGVDRTLDVFKHANAAGASDHGGVVAIMGDDHGCQSSTLPHQSEQAMAAAMIPVLNPASVQDHLDYGLLGFALSRFSGCWVGLKATTEIIESSAIVDVDPMRMAIAAPSDFAMPAGGLGIRWPDAPLDQERRLHGPKMEAVLAFARANRVDHAVWTSPRAQLGLIASGKAYGDVRQALQMLGLDERQAAALGLGLFKVGMAWPLEPEGAAAFAEGLRTVLVVEEKRGLIEDQLALQLYNRERRPTLVGKRDEDGEPLLPSAGEITPLMVAAAIVGRLARLGGPLPALEDRLRRLAAATPAPTPVGRVNRTPFFCSGCPHNTSTNVPEGSRAMAGIGCHGMAYSQPERRTSFITQMGGEGATWIGQAPFTSEAHVFQNLGDGTYMHSGLLAIRAAAAAGVNITYKILFNDAVAMTGGQAHDGELNVPLITRQVAAEGARRIVVVTDEPDRYQAVRDLAAGTVVRHRDELDQIQRELREVPGLSVMVYDQTCAAEKRRRRKRGQYPDPPKRVFINSLVCEGCGDCSVQSNCISVKPLETPLGRKRRIDQSDCNKDFSCLKGFCPSFVTVRGGKLRKMAAGPSDTALPQGPPDPEIAPLSRPHNILVTGIGGTGVITIGALLGMAAHLDGLGASVLDFTGLAQKNGGVMSHVQIAPRQSDLHASRIAEGSADLLLACDLVVAASTAALSRLDPERTRAVVNARVAPTAAFVRDGAIDLSSAADRKAVRRSVRPGAAFIDASGLATALMGDSIATNLFMLGHAWQAGLVPISFGALDRAIELNGVAVEANRKAFAWGRLSAYAPAALAAVAKPAEELIEGPVAFDLHGFVAARGADLTAYQDVAYAQRYQNLVARARAAETARMGGPGAFTEAVARNAYRLMAYKDEYEVARLFTDGRFAAELAEQFEGNFKLEFNLAPPLIAPRDPATGRSRKTAYGAWMMLVFRLLARLKRLRGGPFDVFGYQAERRQERSLVEEYHRIIGDIAGRLADGDYEAAVEIAQFPDRVRGYGHVKDANLAAAREELPGLVARMDKASIKIAVGG